MVNKLNWNIENTIFFGFEHNANVNMEKLYKAFGENANSIENSVKEQNINFEETQLSTNTVRKNLALDIPKKENRESKDLDSSSPIFFEGSEFDSPTIQLKPLQVLTDQNHQEDKGRISLIPVENDIEHESDEIEEKVISRKTLGTKLTFYNLGEEFQNINESEEKVKKPVKVDLNSYYKNKEILESLKHSTYSSPNRNKSEYSPEKVNMDFLSSFPKTKKKGKVEDHYLNKSKVCSYSSSMMKRKRKLEDDYNILSKKSTNKEVMKSMKSEYRIKAKGGKKEKEGIRESEMKIQNLSKELSESGSKEIVEEIQPTPNFSHQRESDDQFTFPDLKQTEEIRNSTLIPSISPGKLRKSNSPHGSVNWKSDSLLNSPIDEKSAFQVALTELQSIRRNLNNSAEKGRSQRETNKSVSMEDFQISQSHYITSGVVSTDKLSPEKDSIRESIESPKPKSQGVSSIKSKLQNKLISGIIQKRKFLVPHSDYRL